MKQYFYSHFFILILIVVFLFAGIWQAGCSTSLPPQSRANPFLADTSQFPVLKYLIKDSAVLNQIYIDSTGISILDDKSQDTLWKIYPDEYTLANRLLDCLPTDSLWRLFSHKQKNRWPKSFSHHLCPKQIYKLSNDSLQPLKGLKVALDPGHIAGDIRLAEAEGKYVKMRASRKTRYEPIQFFEANLTLATAFLIRDELEKLGARIFMTRTQAGQGTMGISYEEWKANKWDSIMQAEIEAGILTEEEKEYWQQETRTDLIMGRFFTPYDLKLRAEKINAFRPHLTLIIHYNIHSPNWENRDEWGFFTPADENYAMAFVPGSFMTGELEDSLAKIDFLRLLLSNDVNASIELTDAFMRYSELLTGVAIVAENQQLRYLDRASVYTKKPGVYARNLGLTRTVKGPLCYGESLCQDHISEAWKLNKKNLEVEGLRVSDRLEWVAKAYVEAVKEFASKQ